MGASVLLPIKWDLPADLVTHPHFCHPWLLLWAPAMRHGAVTHSKEHAAFPERCGGLVPPGCATCRTSCLWAAGAWCPPGPLPRAPGGKEMCHAAALMGSYSVAVLSMLSNPLGNVLGKPPLGFLPPDPIGSDLSEKFSTPMLRNSRLDSRSLLDSRSSSPSDSDTSGFSSGSDHLSDLIVSLGFAPAWVLLVLCCVSGEHGRAGGAVSCSPACLGRGRSAGGSCCAHTDTARFCYVWPRVWKEGCSCNPPSAQASSILVIFFS